MIACLAWSAFAGNATNVGRIASRGLYSIFARATVVHQVFVYNPLQPSLCQSASVYILPLGRVMHHVMIAFPRVAVCHLLGPAFRLHADPP